jgi:hypothetical protein
LKKPVQTFKLTKEKIIDEQKVYKKISKAFENFEFLEGSID